MGYLILFDEEKNVVEIQYEGVNAALLAEINIRLTNLENEFEQATDGVDGELGSLEDDINSLYTLIQAQSSALTEEISNRTEGDSLLQETGSAALIAQQEEYTRMIEAEAEARGQAILDEATARGAAIAESEAIIMTDVAILATTVEGMATELGAAQSSIIEVQDSLVTETFARTAQYTALQADFADTNAAILEESVARASEDEALAYQISILTVSTGDNSAAILAEQVARTNADAALASSITTLSATVGSNTAAISAEATTRANADSALSSQITTLSSTVGSNTAAITTEATARANADSSISAKYAVKVAANGKVAGFGLIAEANNDVSHSLFVVDADSFKVFNGASDLPPFQVTGGVVRMQNVIIGNAVIDNLAINNRTIDVLAVETPKIQNAAVTTKASAASPGVAAGLQTVSVGITTTGANVTVFVCGVGFTSALGVTATVSFILKRDGTTLYTWSVSDTPPGSFDSAVAHMAGTFIYEDVTPSPGAHTYDFQCSATSSNGRAIVCLETKK